MTQQYSRKKQYVYYIKKTLNNIQSQAHPRCPVMSFYSVLSSLSTWPIRGLA